MKKIMILGGGINQKGIIAAAKKEGYYVVLCDKNPECLCKNMADRFCNTDIISTEAVYQRACEEHIDGIISNSETVMEVVAEVASRLRLPGNPRDSVRTLQIKSQFRDHQKNIGLYAPKHIVVSDTDNIAAKLAQFNYPVIIKPVQCSGTRGTTRIDCYDEKKISEAINECIRYSRNNCCAIEEYVQMPSLNMLEGDIFINKGIILWDGLFFTKRSADYPMIPMTYMIPYRDSEEHMQTIKNSFTELFYRLNITHGQYNVEAYFDDHDRFFIIEVNARQGGHGLPEFVMRGTGIDMDKLLVSTAVDDNSYFDEIINRNKVWNFAIRHTIFSNQSGEYQGLYISPELRDYVESIEMNVNIGDRVEKVINGASYIGFANLLFSTYEEQHKYGENMENYIYPIVK